MALFSQQPQNNAIHHIMSFIIKTTVSLLSLKQHCYSKPMHLSSLLADLYITTTGVHMMGLQYSLTEPLSIGLQYFVLW